MSSQPNRPTDRPAPQLIDRAALAQHRARARRSDDLQRALFLHEAARDEAQDRLMMVNREFKSPAIVTPYPEVWQGLLPEAKIIPDDDVLDLEVGAHDLVIHALALHWANDPVGQLIQCRRALSADGLNITLAFGGETLAELRAALGQAEIEISGGLSPRVLPMGEIRDLGALLQRAGLALPVADSLPLDVSYSSALHLMRDLRSMGESNALGARLRRPTRRAVLLRAAEIYAETYAREDGRLRATFELVTLTGWAPDESQQKPLRPGSAAHRLADALGARETPLKD
ncbi:SAM-dependent methyltransferase [Salipiger sp. PrR002]|uniref:SAM-dependent methyltransferase n=1 Tax=Salipiger sp. PrR002 TaxID=2706489 RepID=UPI0013BC7E92|nr:SAM-dependent methyltransferase [Salipiger sp. PrR002]NDV98225.1 SAM-dependent methyltransferase [Salipiger sp. PrR002]NDW54937.1 SAM-dependent methyltransferase [Salipiger sp. PrR004]